MGKKIGIFIIVFVTIIFTASISACGFSFYRTLDSVFRGDEGGFSRNFKIANFCTGKSELVSSIPKFLGNKSYVILFQNNMELRPSGGFMGSYALVKFENSVLKEWKVEDIYVPDGQLKGHVDPPPPIQQAFRNGDWKLRDANWQIDFPRAAADIEWFFDKGGVQGIDGIVALNLGLARKWLNIVGDIKPVDFSETVNAENFFTLAQTYAEEDFFPGSIKKQNYLASVAKALLTKTLEAGNARKISLIRLVYRELENGQVLVWLKNQPLQDLLAEAGWDGSLGKTDFDYFYPVESNLGSNKANFHITRRIRQSIGAHGNRAINITVIEWKNEGKPDANFKWAGEYVNYQRIVIPNTAEVLKIEINGRKLTLDNDKDFFSAPAPREDSTYQMEAVGVFKIVGFWAIVPLGGQTLLEFEYSLLGLPGNQYSLVFRRQPGIEAIPYTLAVNGKIKADEAIEKDEKFLVKI